MLNALIIQPRYELYRKKLFIELSKHYNISILHFGNKIHSNLNQINGLKTDLYKIKYIHKLKSICNNYDFIIVMFDPHWVNCFFLPFMTDKPVIFWGHGLGSSRFIRPLRMLVANKANSIITYDKKGKHELMGIGVNKDKIYVAHNTIAVPNHQDYSRCSKDSIVFLGRLQKRKELHVLLYAFSKIIKSLPKVTMLKIIGDGVAKRNLKSIASDLGILNNVQFIDAIFDNDLLSKHFKSAYCYASPGPVGLGVLHSFAYGVPVITFRNRNHGPEVSNISNNYNSILVDGSADEFAVHLYNMIVTGAYSKLGGEAYKHYSNKRTLNQMVDGFISAINYSINI